MHGETVKLRRGDQIYLVSIEMWCCRRVEKVSWSDRVRNSEVLHSVKVRNILRAVKIRKVNWAGHILRRNCLLKRVIEGKIEEFYVRVTVHRDMWPCIVTNFFIIKPTRCTNFTNLFWHETLHVSDNSSVHHQEFIHCTLSNGICHIDNFRAGPGWNRSSILVLLEICLQTCMTYTIAEFTVNKLLMMDRGIVRNM